MRRSNNNHTSEVTREVVHSTVLRSARKVRVGTEVGLLACAAQCRTRAQRGSRQAAGNKAHLASFSTPFTRAAHKRKETYGNSTTMSTGGFTKRSARNPGPRLSICVCVSNALGARASRAAQDIRAGSCRGREPRRRACSPSPARTGRSSQGHQQGREAGGDGYASTTCEVMWAAAAAGRWCPRSERANRQRR